MKAIYLPSMDSANLKVAGVGEAIWIISDQFNLVLDAHDAAELIMQLTDALNPPSTKDAVKRIDFAKVASEVTPE